MKRNLLLSLAVAALLAAGLSATLVGCMGGGDGTETTVSLTAITPSAQTSTSTTLSGSLDAEALSTFRSKDPFIQQAIPPTTTSTTQIVPGTTTTRSIPRTTTTRPTGGTTSTTVHVTSTTTTTAPHRHSLKILAIGTVSGAPAVTFQVDNSIYKDKRKGDVVSSSWGQIKILDINVTSKTVTLMQGSETLVLTVGQQIFE